MLWTIYGSNIPEELKNSENDFVKHNLGNYRIKVGGHEYFLYDGENEAAFDDRFLSYFALYRYAILNRRGLYMSTKPKS